MRKICPHIIGGYSGQLGHPRVAKLVDVDAAYVRQVRAQVGPDTLIIVRWVQPHDHQPLDEPGLRARNFVTKYAPAMLEMVWWAEGEHDQNIAFSGYNEIGKEQAAAYNEFECARLEEMHALGLRSIVGDWSVGRPDFPEWAIYQPLLDAMGPSDLLGAHEYWIDLEDIANRYHIARFSMVPALDDVPIVITETGRDVVEGQGHAGWIGHCNREEYLAEARAADAVYCQYPNVLGATMFTLGEAGDDWRRFQLSGIWDQVVFEGAPWRLIPVPIPPKLVALPIPGARVSQKFGENPAWYPKYAGHPGVDLATPRHMGWAAWHGAYVQCTIAGKAYTIEDKSGYGFYVYIMGNEADELLAHLSGFTISNGAYVRAGDVVGRVGYTGNCNPTGGAGTHLHWGIRKRPLQLGNGFRGYVDPQSL